LETGTGRVRVAVNRAVVAARKGLQEKEDSIRAVEITLTAINDEEFHQRLERRRDKKDKFR